MVSFDWDADRAKEVAYEEGRADGRIAAIKEFALSLLRNKAPMNLITETTKLSVEEVEKIAKENHLSL